jgi:hypothetical protein
LDDAGRGWRRDYFVARADVVHAFLDFLWDFAQEEVIDYDLSGLVCDKRSCCYWDLDFWINLKTRLVNFGHEKRKTEIEAETKQGKGRSGKRND